MNIIHKQTWYHIEQFFEPTFGTKIIQVMDLFIDSPEIKLEFDEDIIGIRIFCRNLNKNEIPFIEIKENNSTYFLLNLDISSLPSVRPELRYPDLNTKYKHAKIEIEYIQFSPKITENKKFGVTTSYESEIHFPGLIQPEFYITLPKGREIGYDESFLTHCYKSIMKGQEGKAIKLEYNLGDVKEEIKLLGPYINYNNGKKRYSYTVDDIAFKSALNKINSNTIDEYDERDLSFTINFKSYFDNKIILFSLFPLVFLFFAFNIFIQNLNICSNLNFKITNLSGNLYHLNPNKNNSLNFSGDGGFNICLENLNIPNFINNPSFEMPYLILLLSYSIFYYSLLKEGYKIPYQTLYPLFVISCIALILKHHII